MPANEDEPSPLALTLYFFLLALLLSFLVLYAFNLVQIKGDKFTVFLISLIFVLALLPIAYYIKFFSIVEIRRELKAFKDNADKSLHEVRKK